MAWFSKEKKLKSKAVPAGPVPAAKGETIWVKCDGCGEVVYNQEWERNWNVCPACAHHAALPSRRRFELVLDPGSFQELDAELTPQDPLGFTDAKKYRDRIKSTWKATGLRDAFVSGVGANSLTTAYGFNRADWSYIPGGSASGTALIRPDFPELKHWPFFWQQTEYVMGGGETNFMFLALAADRLYGKGK